MGFIYGASQASRPGLVMGLRPGPALSSRDVYWMIDPGVQIAWPAKAWIPFRSNATHFTGWGSRRLLLRHLCDLNPCLVRGWRLQRTACSRRRRPRIRAATPAHRLSAPLLLCLRCVSALVLTQVLGASLVTTTWRLGAMAVARSQPAGASPLRRCPLRRPRSGSLPGCLPTPIGIVGWDWPVRLGFCA